MYAGCDIFLQIAFSGCCIVIGALIMRVKPLQFWPLIRAMVGSLIFNLFFIFVIIIWTWGFPTPDFILLALILPMYTIGTVLSCFVFLTDFRRAMGIGAVTLIAQIIMSLLYIYALQPVTGT